MEILKLRPVAKTIVNLNYLHQRITNPKTTVYDGNDPRDFIAQKMLKTPKVKFKKYKNLFEQTKQDWMNQGKDPSCTAYGTTCMKRIQDSMEHGQLIKHDPEFLWDMQGRPKNGDLLTRSLKTCIYNPFLTEKKFYAMLGYAKVRNRNDGSQECIDYMKKWLLRDYPIKTGIIIKKLASGKSNMYKAGVTGILKLDEGDIDGGHDMTIVGFDDTGEKFGEKGFIFGTQWGRWGVYKNGLSLLPYDQVKYLMSCYISYDAKDIK